MQGVLIYINVFLVLAFAAAGFHRLFMIMISKDAIFGRWQNVLSRLERKSRSDKAKFFYDFWYKSLGGCDVCSRQRIAEMTYLGFLALLLGKGYWITDGMNTILSVVLNIWLYVLFCGLVMYAGKILDKKRQKVVREEIIEQNPIVRN
jgi:hypothetical protein